MRSFYPDGGVIPYADVVILRVYPKLYMETINSEGTGDGGETTVRIVRSEKDEEIEARENEVLCCCMRLFGLCCYRLTLSIRYLVDILRGLFSNFPGLFLPK